MNIDCETIDRLVRARSMDGFQGEVETDSALRATMSTQNSVFLDVLVAPRHEADAVALMRVLDLPDFADLPLTARGCGTGTNGRASITASSSIFVGICRGCCRSMPRSNGPMSNRALCSMISMNVWRLSARPEDLVATGST
jgi:hypothetical protein